ncbi:MAG: uroporphyrinogen decarboxylase family protein [Saccharolobus sp.]|uniref:uroporphyrinogen decarboxylase family protein n=1 Tax=Saccharolobus sp. TaxID=2100761 RepID=UPI00317490EE
MASFLSGHFIEEIPVFPLIGFHSAKIFGIDFIKAVNNSEIMASLQQKATEYYDIDGIVPIMDLSVEPEALGAKVRYVEGIPAVEEFLPIEGWKNLENKLGEYLSLGRIPVFLNSVKLMSLRVRDRMICAYVSGPLTLASEIFGPKEVALLSLKNPSLYNRILNLASKFSSELARAFVEMGAECIIILEPIGALISQKTFRSSLLNNLNIVIDEIRKSKAWSILHICGDARKVFSEMTVTNANALSIDKYIRISEALKIAGNKALMGNIGTSEILLSKPEEIRKYTLNMLRESEGKIIVSTGCEVPPATPQENLREMIKAVRDFSKNLY